MQPNAEEDAISHAWGEEHLVPLAPPGVVGGFGGELGGDFLEFVVDGPVVVGDAVDASHGCFGFVDAAAAVGKPGAFGEEQDADAEDDGPEEADTHGDTPGATVEAFFGAEVDAAGEEDAKRDEELVGAL